MITVMVSTFDDYAACWSPFCHGWNKYWPDCPWPMRFITNYLDSPCGEALKTGDDTDWSVMTRKALGMVETPVVLIICEDCWLTAPVDVQAMRDFGEIMLCDKADVIGICFDGTLMSRGDFLGDPRLYILADSEPYKASLHATLWQVDAFLESLELGWSPWEFEATAGPQPGREERWLRTKKYGYLPYISPLDPEYRISAVGHGEWTEGARRYAAAEGLEIDFSRHPKDRSRR